MQGESWRDQGWAAWMTLTQPPQYKRGTISLNTRESLEAFGFDWEPRARKQRVGADSALPGTVFKTRDQRRFAELREFARMHGGSLRVVLSKDPCSMCVLARGGGAAVICGRDLTLCVQRSLMRSRDSATNRC